MDIQAQLDAFPLPAQKRGILSEIDKAATEQAIDTLIANPAAAAKALADRLIEPGTEGNDIQARHAMHAVAIRIPARDEGKRAEFSKALAATLSDDRPERVKGFIIRQLQLCGGGEAAGALGAFLTSNELADDAAQALIAIRDGAAEQFRDALPKVADDTSLKNNVIHGLAGLADGESKDAFVTALSDADGETRLLAMWGLAEIADASTVDAFLAAEQKEEGFSRTKAASLCLQFAEKLPEEQSARIYKHLVATRTRPEESYLRDLASAAL